MGSDGKHEGFNMTPPHETKVSKSSDTSAKSLLNRSNSFSRFLGRSDSKRSQRTNASSSNLQQPDVYSHAPSSPKTINQKVIIIIVKRERMETKIERREIL
jgi:mitogen-activated protein kinase kinase kinase